MVLLAAVGVLVLMFVVFKAADVLCWLPGFVA
jgi:hypothetical protein